MRKTIRIGGKGPGKGKDKTPGALRYEALTFLAKTEHLGPWHCEPWMNKMLNHLEERFTSIRPSVSDRAALMTAIAALVAEKPPPGAPENIDDAAAYLAESLGLDATGDPELRFFDDSPDAGDPLCICSYCECLIQEGTVPIRLFEGKREQRLHVDCFHTCINYGLVDPNVIKRM